MKNKIKTSENKQDGQTSEKNIDTSLSLEAIGDNDAKMKLFARLTYCQFCILFNFLGNCVYNLTYWDGKNESKENTRKGNRTLEPKDELFLTLVRLRRGYSVNTMEHFLELQLLLLV